MKSTRPTPLRLKRMVVLLGALGLSSAVVRAQENSSANVNDTVVNGTLDTVRGKMVDRSRTELQAPPASSEIQSDAFAALPPSGLTLNERKMMLENTAPLTQSQRTATIEDRRNDANFESGRATLRAPAVAALDQLLATLAGKSDVHFEITGFTDSQQIARSYRKVFPDNQALSEARALAVADYLKTRLHINAAAFTVHGKGESEPVASNATPEGMAKNRRVEIRIWFAEAATQAPQAVEKLIDSAACASNTGVKDLPFSISVDGQPLNTAVAAQEADGQRCVDVALEKAAIQIKYDPLNVAPALNVWVAASSTVRGKPIYFGSYTNYAWWLRKGEVRIFAKGENTQGKPLAIVPIAPGGAVEWVAPANAPSELAYLVRVYDEQGRFDETLLKPMRLQDRSDPLVDAQRIASERLAGWGESNLRIKNIPAHGGAVTVSGERIKPDEVVTAMGIVVPVDDKGRFVMRQILPSGPHSIEVSVKDHSGVGATFRRNLTIADRDWFYVAVADLTVGRDHTAGPAALVTEDGTHYNNATWADGRAAFYAKGKLGNDYLLTASADTTEQPISDMFSNFASKDPNYLLRNIDPNYYYPVYGDDSVIVDDAPTQGKFFVKVEKNDSYAMWGNFQTAWTGTELTQYSRGLYGANVVWNSNGSTSYGEKNTSVNAFVAEPGTLQSRNEFRGTGGSLYYLSRTDITQGSERLWVEVRDKDSGLVLQRTPLTEAQDYEIDYIQGRLTLRAPLPSVTDGSTLVQTASLPGDPVYLVATYEYVPGLTAISGSTVGVRASHWINDNARVGTTVYRENGDGSDENLEGVDGTLRYKPGTWIKGEAAHSSGTGSPDLTSISGGFNFAQNTSTLDSGSAERVDAAVDLSELDDGIHGRFTAYWQNRQAGFSGPGLLTAGGESLHQIGMAGTLPVNDKTEVMLKTDDRTAPSQSANSDEVALRHKIDAEWGISGGMRHDNLETSNTGDVLVNASPLLSQNGTRTDVIVRVDYRPLKAGEAEKLQQQQLDGTAAPAPLLSASALPVNPQTAPAPAAPGASSGGFNNTATGPASSLIPRFNANGGVGMQATADATSAVGVAAARLPGLQYEPWDTYGFVQGTVERTGNRSDNDRVGVGGSWQVSNRVRLGAEVSAGDGGVGGRLSGDYQVDDRSTLYLSYAMESENPDSNYAGRQGTLTSGTHYRYSDQIGTFAETRWANGAGPQSLTHAFGVDFSPSKEWTTGVKFETGTLSDPVSGDLKRDAIGLTLSYKYQELKVSSQLEFRSDHTTTLGTVAGTCITPDANGVCTNTGGVSSDERRTWLFKNSVGYQADPSWRLLGKFNLSRSVDSQGAFYDGDYTEIVLGTAYRPVNNDRWNTLFKYTYFYNLPSAAQIDSVTGTALDYEQKSHVFNIDTTYDLFPWLSVGAKYGLRIGQLSDSTTVVQWFSSRASLEVLRFDLHLVKEWDALVEARRLAVTDALDARSGFLIGAYRHVTDHAKIGVGYNFTTYSDDLTNLSYRSKGFFMNAISTF